MSRQGDVCRPRLRFHLGVFTFAFLVPRGSRVRPIQGVLSRLRGLTAPLAASSTCPM